MLSKFLTTKKIALILLFIFLFSTLFSKPIQAFSTPNATYQFQFENAVYKTPEMNLQSFVYETLKATVGSVITSIFGCFSCDEKERKENPGLVMNMSGLIAGVYANPPASGVQYLAYLGNRLDITQPAYAQEQGTGFQAMMKILPVWKAFRDLSYVFFILIFIFMGFAIMFRVKISPQAVITIQSAIPKIVLALILVTFSYAIVGFLIDIMYVAVFLIINIFAKIPYIDSMKVQDILDLVENHIFPLFGAELTLMQGAVITSIFAFLIVPITALAFSIALGPVSWLFFIIAVILILIALLRCFWTLLKAWAMVIVYLVFAPFQILVGVLPGSNAIGTWFKNLLANIAVLPAMVTMFFLSSYLIMAGIMGVIIDIPDNPLLFIRTIITGWIPVVGEVWAILDGIFNHGIGNWEFFSLMVLPITGLMILLMAPKVSDMIQSFIRGKPFEYGVAIGEAVTGPPSMAIRGGIMLAKIGEAWPKRFGLTRIFGGAESGRAREEAPPVPDETR